MEVRVVPRIHRDDGGGRAFVREHADEDEEGVVDPIEGRVCGGVEAGGVEHGDDAVGHGEVGDELVGDVFGRVDVGDGGFGGFGVGGDLDFVAEGGPVSSL